MRIKQSICLPMLTDGSVSLDRYFAALAEIGFAAVELWGRDETFEAVARTARKHKLVLASMVAHTIEPGLNDPAGHDRIIKHLKRELDVAAGCGMPGIICFSGNRRRGLSDKQGIENTARCLSRLAPYAEKKGVNLNLELLNSKVDHIGYQCDRTPWAVAACRKVNSPRVKVLYDIYHMQIMEGDLIRTIRENAAMIGHFHTAGVPGRRDPDETQEINYAAVAAVIAETDYDLYVGHEFAPKGNVMAALRKTFKIFDKG